MRLASKCETEIENQAVILESVPNHALCTAPLHSLLVGASTDIVNVIDGHCGGGSDREETDDR